MQAVGNNFDRRARLTGTSPFQGSDYNEILIKNKNCDIKFSLKGGHGVSEQGKYHLHLRFLSNVSSQLLIS